MTIWRMLATVAIAQLASQALAEDWITVASNNGFDGSTSIDKDSIRRASDGLVYFTLNSSGDIEADAADCSKRVLYILNSTGRNGEHRDYPDWRDDDWGAVLPKTIGEVELQYVCANAG